jgi:hypothetical protein
VFHNPEKEFFKGSGSGGGRINLGNDVDSMCFNSDEEEGEEENSSLGYSS